jgi:RecG-like helicase
MAEQQFKRHTAYKMRIGNILAGKVVLEGERFKVLEFGDKNVQRANVIANIVDKYIQEGEKKFASMTLDDGSGQIKLKSFGDEVEKFANFNQGDTVMAIGLLRYWNKELYITPEIIKKKDPSFLLVRKLEVEAEQPKNLHKEELTALKDKMLAMIKDAEKDNGIEVEKIITELHEHPDVINNEIKKLLEGGVAYEPRPGKLRYLG